MVVRNSAFPSVSVNVSGSLVCDCGLSMIGVYIYTNIFSVLVSELFPDLQSPNTSSASPIHQHHIIPASALSRPGPGSVSLSGHPLCLSRATRMLAAWMVSPRGVTQYPSSSLELIGFLEDSYPNPNSYIQSHLG